MTHDRDVSSVAVSSDSEYVVSGSRDDTARVWKVATGDEVACMGLMLTGRMTRPLAPMASISSWVVVMDMALFFAFKALPRLGMACRGFDLQHLSGYAA